MRTLYLDGRDYASAEALHQALKRLLALPGYYGGNADALHDCLSERDEPLRLWLAHGQEGGAARALTAVCAVDNRSGRRGARDRDIIRAQARERNEAFWQRNNPFGKA